MTNVIESTGKEVIIVKDGKFLAKGTGVMMYGNTATTIMLYDEYVEKYFSKISDSSLKIMKIIGHVRYKPTDGSFLNLSINFVSSKEENTADEIINMFTGTIIVDSFKLGFGLVSGQFSDPEECKRFVESIPK